MESLSSHQLEAYATHGTWGQVTRHVQQQTMNVSHLSLRRVGYRMAKRLSTCVSIPPIRHWVTGVNREQLSLIEQLHGPRVVRRMCASGQLKTLPLNRRQLAIAESEATEQALMESKRDYITGICTEKLLQEGHSLPQLRESHCINRFVDVLLKYGGDRLDWSADFVTLSKQVEALVKRHERLQLKLLITLQLLVHRRSTSIEVLRVLESLSISLEMKALLTINRPSTSESLRNAIATGIPDHIGSPLRSILMRYFTKEQQQRLKKSLMSHVGLRRLVGVFSPKVEATQTAALLERLGNPSKTWVVGMQRATVTLLALVKTLEIQLNRTGLHPVAEDNAVDAADWEQALVAAPNASKCVWLNQAFLKPLTGR